MVLAGGRATRFGGAPKGLTRIHGERIIDRVANVLRATCDDLLLVANAPDAAEWLHGVHTVADVVQGQGSLGGIHAALVHAGGPVIVVAWDMPFVPATLLADLRAAGANGAAAVVPEGPDGPEPLCAYYASTCRAVAERLLSEGERRARVLGTTVGAVRFPVDISRYGDPHRAFHNVNTAHDLAVAESVNAAPFRTVTTCP